MTKLDLKDRKILYELDGDSRQSFAKIGKKIGMSKDLVLYRVKKLMENEIIDSFYTHIDSFKLGYFSVRFYLIFQNITPDLEMEIIDFYANKNKFLLNCASIEGRFDLVVNMWVKHLDDFYAFWEEGLKKYRNYIQKEIFSIFIESIVFRYSYLLLDKYEKSDREKNLKVGISKEKVEIDDLDWEILKLLVDNARIPIAEIAHKLNSTSMIVNYRIKKLQKLDVIKKFGIKFNLQKLGYTRFKVDIFLNDYRKKYQILNYIRYNPHLIWISKSIGVSDLELEFDVENLDQLHQILQDLTIRFPNMIRNYRYFNVIKGHALTFLPEK